MFLRYGEYCIDEEVERSKGTINEQLLHKMEEQFQPYSMYFLKKQETTKNLSKNLYSELWISHDLRFAQSNFYEIGFLKNTRATIILSIVDFYWTEHIERMNFIRETVNWRAYGQQNPIVEYNTEAFKSFKLMFEQIRSSMIYYFLSNSIN